MKCIYFKLQPLMCPEVGQEIEDLSDVLNFF